MKSKRSFKKVLVILVISTLFPVFILLSNDGEAQKSPVIKGANLSLASGTRVRWQDVKKVSFDSANTIRRMRPIMNYSDPRRLVKKSNEIDPVVQTSFPPFQESVSRSLAIGAPLMNFEGMNQQANGVGWPPDTNGDVGLDYYVQAVNSSIGIYHKSTGALVAATTFDSFFPTTIGGPCDSNNNGDPIVLYDRTNQRWFILGFSWYSSTVGGSFYSIAASATADPTGDWWTYCLNADKTLLNDYPKCGVWSDGIYVTANMFQFSGSFQHVKVWALKTPELYNGTLTAQSIIEPSTFAFSLLPANARGGNPPAPGTPNYMYALDADEYGGTHADALNIWKYKVDWRVPANTTWTGPAVLPVAAYEITVSGVPQQDTANVLDSLFGRLMYSAVYRKFPGYEAVYLSHVADYRNRRAMRWYELRILAGDATVYQQGTYSPDAIHRWMGSVCADKNGNIAIGYSASASSMFPAIRYCGRLASDPHGLLTQGEITLFAGTGSQTDYSRWGDYSVLTIDPVDDETFWYTTEYLAVTGTKWRSRIGSFKMNNLAPTRIGSLEEAAPNPDPLARAMDNKSLVFTTSGEADWLAQTNTSFYGGDAAQSPTLTHDEKAVMETVISGYTIVKFYWKVSSEADNDELFFYVDGVLKDQISGQVNWVQKSINISAGTHKLRWTYSKDDSISEGADTGWVDRLELQ